MHIIGINSREIIKSIILYVQAKCSSQMVANPNMSHWTKYFTTIVCSSCTFFAVLHLERCQTYRTRKNMVLVRLFITLCECNHLLQHIRALNRSVNKLVMSCRRRGIMCSPVQRPATDNRVSEQFCWLVCCENRISVFC